MSFDRLPQGGCSICSDLESARQLADAKRVPKRGGEWVKVFVSVDMEGVSGVTDPEDVLPNGSEYQTCRRYMTGDATGETRLNAGLAGSYGVPVALVAGDVAVCEEAKRVLPWVETVAVKDGIDKYAAVCKHPEVAAAEIREATARALKNKGFKPYVVKPPITIGIEWNSTTTAQTCGLIPGVKR